MSNLESQLHYVKTFILYDSNQILRTCPLAGWMCCVHVWDWSPKEYLMAIITIINNLHPTKCKRTTKVIVSLLYMSDLDWSEIPAHVRKFCINFENFVQFLWAWLVNNFSLYRMVMLMPMSRAAYQRIPMQETFMALISAVKSNERGRMATTRFLSPSPPSPSSFLLSLSPSFTSDLQIRVKTGHWKT